MTGIQNLFKINKSKKADFTGSGANSENQMGKPAFSLGLTIVLWGLFIYGIYIIAGNINYNLNSENYSYALATITDNIIYYTHFCFFGVSAVVMIITGIYRHFKMAKQQALIPEAQIQEFLKEKKSNQVMIAFGGVILSVTVVVFIFNFL